MDALLNESFERLLQGVCSPAVVREVERSADASALWAEVEASGYLDLLASEGGGAALRDAFPLWLACGWHLLPVPLAQVMWARGLMGSGAPAGPIAIAPVARREADGTLSCAGVPFGAVAQALLLTTPEGDLCCVPRADAQVQRSVVHGSLQADFVLPAPARPLPQRAGGSESEAPARLLFRGPARRGSPRSARSRRGSAAPARARNRDRRCAARTSRSRTRCRR